MTALNGNISTSENAVIWLEDPTPLRYVRERVACDHKSRARRPKFALNGRLVGYTTLDPKARSRERCGLFVRREFWLAPHDHPNPDGPYAVSGRPCEGVDPRTVLPGGLDRAEPFGTADSPLAHERGIVWLADPRRFVTVRETVLDATGRTDRPRVDRPGTLLGYAVLAPDAPAAFSGRWLRRGWWVADDDLSAGAELAPESVDPRFVLAGRGTPAFGIRHCKILERRTVAGRPTPGRTYSLDELLAAGGKPVYAPMPVTPPEFATLPEIMARRPAASVALPPSPNGRSPDPESEAKPMHEETLNQQEASNRESAEGRARRLFKTQVAKELKLQRAVPRLVRQLMAMGIRGRRRVVFYDPVTDASGRVVGKKRNVVLAVVAEHVQFLAVTELLGMALDPNGPGRPRDARELAQVMATLKAGDPQKPDPGAGPGPGGPPPQPQPRPPHPQQYRQ
jgi:hypothetical protein